MPHADSRALPFVFDIAIGLRRGDARLHDEVDDFIVRRRPDIDAILTEYGVPRVESR
jgi:mxaJ protein